MNLLKEFLNFFGFKFYTTHILSRKGKIDLEIKARQLAYNCYGTNLITHFHWTTKMWLYQLENGDYLYYCDNLNKEEEIVLFRNPVDVLEKQKYDKQLKELLREAGLKISEKLEN